MIGNRNHASPCCAHSQPCVGERQYRVSSGCQTYAMRSSGYTTQVPRDPLMTARKSSYFETLVASRARRSRSTGFRAP
eukprot:7086090-Prymnesium_polylepis.1